jgi:Zn finger protein HypA/HybF involved in hydrogenase expression
MKKPTKDRVAIEHKAEQAARPALRAIEIEVECRDCGTEFTPNSDAFRAGDWRRCPSCRVRAPSSGLTRFSEPDDRGDAA